VVDFNNPMPTFDWGSLDLFGRAQLTPNISVLSELVHHVMDDGMAMTHAPRLFADVGLTDNLVLRAGAFHTPLGYYTSTHPHGGAVFRLANERPYLLNMEMGTEMLPNHSLGVDLKGRGTLGDSLGVRTDLMVANSGRNTAALDTHPFKSLAGRLALRPFAVSGLELGGTAYSNKVHYGHGEEAMAHGPPAPPTSHEEESAEEEEEEDPWVFEATGVGYVLYEEWPIEFLAEVFWILHSEEFMGDGYTLLGGFAQAGYSVDSYTPYLRFEYFDRDLGDPIFAEANAPTSRSFVTAGVRYSLTAKMVAKFEGGYDLVSGSPGFSTQLAFGF